MSDDTTEISVTAAQDRAVEPPPERARMCPACGSFNELRRELCRGCGVDLETGARLPWPEPDPDPAAVAIPLVDRPHPRRWLYVLAAVVAAAGVVLLGLVLAEVGPFAEAPSVPEAVFDPSAHADEPASLVVTDIATVTTLPAEGNRSFIAARMVDDDPETAWRSDGLQEQILATEPLEIIDLILDGPAWVESLLVRNGDQFDPEAYEQEGRVRQVRAVFDGGAMYLLNLLDEGRGLQEVELPEPALTTMIRLEVLDVFPGSQSEGVAVSDIELTGWRALPEEKAVARDRAEALPADSPRM